MYDDHTLAIKNAPLVGNNNNWWLLIEIYDTRQSFGIHSYDLHWHFTIFYLLWNLNNFRITKIVKSETPLVRFKSYPTWASLVRYDLNLALGCHRFYYLAPLSVLDPINFVKRIVYFSVWLYNYLKCTQQRYKHQWSI